MPQCSAARRGVLLIEHSVLDQQAAEAAAGIGHAVGEWPELVEDYGRFLGAAGVTTLEGEALQAGDAQRHVVGRQSVDRLAQGGLDEWIVDESVSEDRTGDERFDGGLRIGDELRGRKGLVQTSVGPGGFARRGLGPGEQGEQTRPGVVGAHGQRRFEL